MYLTSAQKRALWFVVLVFAASLLFQYVKLFFFTDSAYDFSEFDELFIRKRDSILLAEKSAEAENTAVAPEISKEDPEENPLTTQFPVNVNSATAEDLQALPRIGPKMAERIIAYRQRNGPFLNKRDLINVRGIGQKTFEKLEELIVVK